MNKYFEKKKRNINNKKGWMECPSCFTQFEDYNKYKTCRNCGYNFKMNITERLNIVCDDNSFIKIENNEIDNEENIIIGTATIKGYKVAIGIMEAFYKAGSINQVIIDKLCKLINYAKNNKLPLIIFSASGGIRVQEGLKALVGMSKLALAIREYRENGLFISYLTNPTYGGLNASLSMLGDIIISEKNCKIGFGGTRIIEKELNQKLLFNFQTEEFQYQNGMIDIITSRDKERDIIATILDLYSNKNYKVEINKIEKISLCENFETDKLELIKNIRSENHIRPYKIVQDIFTSMIEIRGDRISKDDQSVKCIFAKMDEIALSVIYVNRRNSLKENIKFNFGMINPEGYRKINRFIKLSEKMNLPIILFVDTPGANAGYEAENIGQAGVIANLLQEISKIKVPIISFITGEANSGGAICLITGDYLAMLKHSYLSVISPEAYNDIVYKGKENVANIVSELKILPSEMLKDGIIDTIVDDECYEKMIDNIKSIINNKIIELSKIDGKVLVDNRKNRIEKWGTDE